MTGVPTYLLVAVGGHGDGVDVVGGDPNGLTSRCDQHVPLEVCHRRPSLEHGDTVRLGDRY